MLFICCLLVFIDIMPIFVVSIKTFYFETLIREGMVKILIFKWL